MAKLVETMRPGTHSLCLTAALLALSSSLPARYRLDDSPLFFQDMRAGRVVFSGQGKQFSLAADTTRLEAAGHLKVGLSDHLSFDFGFPYLSEAQGPFSKSGQGDLCTSLSWHQPLRPWPGLQAAARQALVFPSGFRKELTGFQSFTTRRMQWESLVQLELGDRSDQPASLWLAVHGGIRTDNRLENTSLLWGASLRYHLWKRWLALESELAQEMVSSTKEATYQFSAGVELDLPFGFAIRAGAEERVMADLDRFGIYAGLSWSRQPVIPLRIRHRHLQPAIQRRLDAKNKVPSFTLEPGAPSLLSETGRLPFLPLQVVILPFAEHQQAPVAQALCRRIRQVVEQDTSFAVVAEEDLAEALARNRWRAEDLEAKEDLDQLGRILGADLVLRGRILRFDPRDRRGASMPPILANNRQASRLEAQVWLHQVDNPEAPRQAVLAAEAVGPGRWVLFTANRGRHELTDEARRRHELTQRALDLWCDQATNALLYEVTEQLVIDK